MKTTRAGFLGTLAAAGFGVGGVHSETVSPSKPLRVCVFSDLHYCPGTFVNDTPEFLEKILARAEAAKCDMVIHLGDFVHSVRKPETKSFIRKYNDFKIPAYHILGNHDQDGSSWRETCDAYRMPDGHYSFDRGGFRFVIADPNYTRNSATGKFVHHEHGNYFKCGSDTTINWIPPEQLEWMRETILKSPYPCIVLSHQSFERPPNGSGVMNKDAVQAIFNEANAKRPGSVRLVMNGHMHTDHLRILDDILYWDVNSANYQWFGESHAAYPPEFMKSHRLSDHVIGWKTPLSAILTLTAAGGIQIDGSASDYLFGVSPQQAGLPVHDVNGRYTLPKIQSTRIVFEYPRI